MRCPNCGAENNNSDRFCAECGAGLPNYQTPIMNQSQNENYRDSSYHYNQQEKPKKGYANIAMVLAILSIVICFFWPLFGIPAFICGCLALRDDEPEKAKAWFAIIVSGIELLLALVGLLQN